MFLILLCMPKERGELQIHSASKIGMLGEDVLRLLGSLRCVAGPKKV